MDYDKKSFREAELLKLETREDAEFAQEMKYPSGTVLFTGIAHKEGAVQEKSPVYMRATNSFRGFKTSSVMEIEEETPNYIQFKTRNSRYKLIWKA